MTLISLTYHRLGHDTKVVPMNKEDTTDTIYKEAEFFSVIHVARHRSENLGNEQEIASGQNQRKAIDDWVLHLFAFFTLPFWDKINQICRSTMVVPRQREPFEVLPNGMNILWALF